MEKLSKRKSRISSLSVCLVFLFSGFVLAEESEEHKKDFIPYDLERGEAFYQGPGNKAAHWTVQEGKGEDTDEGFRLRGTPKGKARFAALNADLADRTYRRRIGGSLEYEYKFSIQPDEENFSFRITNHRYKPYGVDRSLEEYLAMNKKGQVTAGLQHETASVESELESGKVHTLRIINAGRYKQILLNDQQILGTWIKKAAASSEGRIFLEVRNGALTVNSFRIFKVRPDVPRPNYRKGALLFADDFNSDESRRNWVYEHKHEEGTTEPLIRDGWLYVERFSAAWSRFRAESPVIYTFEYRPIPRPEDEPESIRDAIFLLHASWANYPYDFFHGVRRYTPDANLWTDVNNYWIDYGGNWNKTTRLRRNPYRRMLRESFDEEDMLKTDHTHKVRITLAGHQIRFEVDGRTVLRHWDPDPLESGHFALMGYVRASKLRRFRAFRAVPVDRSDNPTLKDD